VKKCVPSGGGEWGGAGGGFAFVMGKKGWLKEHVPSKSGETRNPSKPNVLKKCRQRGFGKLGN